MNEAGKNAGFLKHGWSVSLWGLLVVCAGPAMAQGINVNAGGTQVKVGADGGVQVKVPGAGVRVDGAGVSTGVQSTTSTQGSVVYDGVSQSWTIKCDGSKVSMVQINGTENTATISGSCKSISVNGTDNKITAETVGSITLQGTDNHLTYKLGLDGKTPKITNNGVDNSAVKIK